MLLGLGSYACTWQIGMPGHPVAQPMDAIGLIDRAVALGLRLVQIDDNLPLETLAPSAVAAIGVHARQRGVAIEVGTRGCEPERLRRFLAIARELGSPLVRVVLDRGADHPDVATAVARLRSVDQAYRDAGVAIAIENHDRFPVAQLRQLLDQAGDQVGICLDTVNSLGCAEGPGEVVAGLLPWIRNLHLKDFRIRRVDHQMGFVVEGTAAGDGQLDIVGIVLALAKAGRPVNAILELWTPPHPAGIAATCDREQEWAELSVANLRRILPASAFATG